MYLFPFKAKTPGLVLILLSVLPAYFYFSGIKPAVFDIKIFAVVSAYLKTRYFVIAQTNILDELAAILILIGIALFSFSKEKDEKPIYTELRARALIKSAYVTLLIWIASFLLIYGMAIFIVSSFIFILFLLCFTLFFKISVYKARKQINHS